MHFYLSKLFISNNLERDAKQVSGKLSITEVKARTMSYIKSDLKNILLLQ